MPDHSPGGASARTRFDLGIDTASDDASLALLDAAGEVVATRAWRVSTTMSQELLAALDALLAGAGVARAEVARIAVDVGPGQYSALRTGIATAQGLALALDVPLAPAPRLEADAWPHLHDGAAARTVVAVHDARSGIAWAAYALDAEGAVREVAAPRIEPAADAARHAPRPAAWCGEDTPALAAARDAEGRSGDTVLRPPAEPRAVTLVRIARARSAFGDPGLVDALYLRPPPIAPPRPR